MKKLFPLCAALVCAFLLFPLFSRAQCGSIATFAGVSDTGRYTGDGGPATAARFNQPSSICRDRAGNVYILDYKNARIRKVVASSGTIVTIAGNGTRGYSGNGGAAISAMIDGSSICCDDSGNVFISDEVHRCVRKISHATGIIRIIAGVPGGSTAPTWFPFSVSTYGQGLGAICADSAGNVYVYDAGAYSVYKINTSNVVSVFCGGGVGMGSFSDGPSTGVLVMAMRMGMDRAGNLYYTEGAKIRRMDTSGYVLTIAGQGTGGDGGPASDARITNYDGAMYVDSIGDVYFSQTNGYQIQKIDAATGLMHSVAGGCCGTYTGWINSLFVTPSGSIVYADSSRYANKLYVNSHEYTAIATASTSDTLLSASCTMPAEYQFGVKGTITGVPHSGEMATVYVIYGDGQAATYTTAYWDTVIGSDTVYGFGADGNWLPSHFYTYPGNYLPSVTVHTINGYTDVFYPPSALVGNVCDYNITNAYIDSISDSIITAPCVYPATVRFQVHGLFTGNPSISDSIYGKVYTGDGHYTTFVVPLDTTGAYWGGGLYQFTATVYHNYPSPGNFYTYGESVLNSGLMTRGTYGAAIHTIHIDTCSMAGIVNSVIRPYDSVTTICSLPYTDTFKITGTLRHASDTIPGIYYYVNYGDGSDDTVYAPMTTDGYGYYTCKASAIHMYTFPGAFATTITPISPTSAAVGTSTGATLTVGNGCGSVSGILYRDVNANCMWDSTETLLSYWPIAVINNTLADTTIYWCDTFGHYLISVINGESYTIMPDYFGAFGYGSDSMRVACPSTGIYNIDTVTAGSYAQDFGFRCFGAPTDLDMGVYGWGFGFIPGDTGAIAIWASNPYGYLCDSLSSTVTLTLDSNLAYEGMLDGAAPSTISGNTLTWIFSTTNDQLDFNANVRVSCLSTVSMGGTLQNTLNVSATTLSDPDTTNNTYTWQQPALSSWDPNEIEVSPKGFGTQGYIQNSTPLSYLVHFQNTGTARARNITINDTISNNLDIATLQLISASGKVVIIQPERSGNVVKFRFSNIFLPDSGADMEGSKGYVSFNIVPKPGLAAGTQITNKVGIYFDYNPPVVTNSTLNTIEDSIGHLFGADSVCVGASTTLTNHIAGGTWHSRNGHATVVAGVVTGVSVGRDTITYIAYDDQTATKIINVHTVANPGTITGSSSVCEAAHITVYASVSGGVWTSTPAATISGSGVVIGVTGGATDTIYYSVTNVCGVASVPKVITINAFPPTGTITGTATSVCAGSTVTYSDAVTGGTWSSGSTAIATVSTTGAVYGRAAGTTNIIYTTTNGCGSRSTSMAVTVLPVPVGGAITGPSAVCLGATISLTNTTGTAGGSWSVSGSSVASIDGSGNLFGNATGSTTVTYAVSTAYCGSAYASTSITVNPIPYGGSVTGLSSVCRTANITLTDVGGTTGGSWSSSATSIASVAAGTGIVTGVAPGTATISYTANTATCGSASATATVTVNALPSAGAITGGSAVCELSNVTLADATGTAGGNWTSSNTALASVSSTGVVYGLAAGSVVISYTAVTATCGNATTSVSFSVAPLPVSGAITGTTSVCPSASTILTDAASGGTWISTNHHSTHSGGIVYGVSAGIDTIGYSVTNSCGTSVARVAVTVYPVPTTAAITGPVSACAGSTVTLADAISGGSWTTSSAIATISGSGVLTGISAGSVVTTYSVSNFCGTSFVTRNFTVDPIISPAVSITVTPGTDVCVGSTASFAASPTNGGSAPTYTWRNGGAYISAGATFSYTPSNGDAITCEMVSNASCLSTASATSPVSTMNVLPFVTPSINITASSDSITSMGQVITFTASVVNGGATPAFQWLIDGGAISGATNASFMQSFYSSQTVYCEMVSSSQCATTAIANSNLLTISVGNLGVSHVANAGTDLSIFPNPNNGQFTIDIPAHENDVNITIIDVNGKAVKSMIVTDNKQTKLSIDMGGVAAGVYMLRAEVDNTIYYKKIVVIN